MKAPNRGYAEWSCHSFRWVRFDSGERIRVKLRVDRLPETAAERRKVRRGRPLAAGTFTGATDANGNAAIDSRSRSRAQSCPESR